MDCRISLQKKHHLKERRLAWRGRVARRPHTCMTKQLVFATRWGSLVTFSLLDAPGSLATLSLLDASGSLATFSLLDALVAP